jgi:hypothetical protein
VPDQPEKESAPPPPQSDRHPPSADAAPETAKLSPEEQMALYENDLKETDWGHQPC